MAQFLGEGSSVLAITALQEAETTNAFFLKVHRREAELGKATTALEAFRSDIESGVFRRISVSWPASFSEVTRLAKKYSLETGTRTLDLLHIAAALTVGATDFITGDSRQAEAARGEKLTVKLL